jgi:hypothetical protein
MEHGQSAWAAGSGKIGAEGNSGEIRLSGVLNECASRLVGGANAAKTERGKLSVRIGEILEVFIELRDEIKNRSQEGVIDCERHKPWEYIEGMARYTNNGR